ncbi:MAG: (5-formylfuran-3-yl)methyl phosphate synthase [Methyloceanibacter sp.]
MTLLLASVRDAEEAELAIGAGADIVDLKDPSQGALGALTPESIAACVRQVAGRAPVSATIGDLTLDGNSVRAAIRNTASLGVDYVKLGIFPGGDPERCLERLAGDTGKLRLILVLFADAFPAFDAIELAAGIGAHGVMFDTIGKRAGALPEHMSYIGLADCIATAKAAGLIVGLAGSLQARHVPSLLALQPDLLGFRGALCQGGDRAKPLDPERLAGVRALIPERPRIFHEPKEAEHIPQALC